MLDKDQFIGNLTKARRSAHEVQHNMPRTIRFARGVLHTWVTNSGLSLKFNFPLGEEIKKVAKGKDFSGVSTLEGGSTG